MSADKACELIRTQRNRCRLLTGAVICCALANAGLAALIVAGFTLSAIGAFAALSLVAAVTAIGLGKHDRPERRLVFARGEIAGQQERQIRLLVARISGQTAVPAPGVRVVDDQAVNALSVGTGSSGTVMYTTGFLDRYAECMDKDAFSAVTAHLVARIASGENRLAQLSCALLGWVLSFYDVAIMRLVRTLRRAGKSCLDFAFGRRLSSEGDEAAIWARLMLWVFALSFGLFFYAAALAIFVAGSMAAFVAAANFKAQIKQRTKFADRVAAELADSPRAIIDALAELDGLPVEVTSESILIPDLSFAGPPPEAGHVKYFPTAEERISWLEGSQTTEPGLLIPAAYALGTLILASALGLAVADVPYGQRAASSATSLSAPPTAAQGADSSPASVVPAVSAPAAKAAAGTRSATIAPSSPSTREAPTQAGVTSGPGAVSPAWRPVSTAPTGASNGTPAKSSPASSSAQPSSAQPVLSPPVPQITGTQTYTEGALVYARVMFAEDGGQPQGFRFTGVNGSGWAEETHSFSSPSYGRVAPGRVDYPFNLACGTAQSTQSDVEFWIYDTQGTWSQPVIVHLACAG